jgi:glycosyltransferase involved in cell wall biosynthesis
MATHSQPLVSVIIPVYNGERFLARALDSILRQDHSPLEIIVVNDGSTDGTAQVIRKYARQVRSVCQPNAGLPATQNQGLRMADGDLIAFLDADDLWPEHRLETQVAYLRDNPATDIVRGRIEYVTALADTGEGLPQWRPLTEPRLVYSLSTALFRRGVFAKVGPFDETLRYAADWDWFVRMKESGITMAALPAVTLVSFRHADNLTNRLDLVHSYTLKMLRKTLARRARRAGEEDNEP